MVGFFGEWGMAMTIDDALVLPATRTADEAIEPYSAAWWECRTAEELRDIIKRGFSGGFAFQAAVAETERRARMETRRLRELAAREAALRRKRIMIGTAASAAAAIAAVVGIWLNY